MPNGFEGTKEELIKYQAPLLKIDNVLRKFTEDNGLELTMNHHGWPERSLSWGKNIRKLIQIYYEDEKKGIFNFWICSPQDRGLKRYWKNAFLKKGVPFSEITRNIHDLLQEGFNELESWKEEDLRFAGEIKKI